jgi:predicted dehydrogenase
VGTLSVCCNQRRYSFVTDVLGTDGILHIDNIAQTITRVASRPTSAAGLVLGRLDSAFQQVTAAGSVLANSLLGRKWYKLGHRALFGGFVASIRGGGPPPVTAEDGLETVNTIEQIWGQLGWPAGPRT